MPKMNPETMKGRKFGQRTVIRLAGRDNSRGYTYLCRCECGREDIVRKSMLMIGKSIRCHSCSAKLTRNRRTHSLAGTRLYNIWKGMVYRSTRKTIANYAGRGIGVCDEWKDPKAFHDWAISSGYADGLTIDRIDVDQGYSPENCRWVSTKQQMENVQLLRSANKSGYRGVSKKTDRPNTWLARLVYEGKIIHLGHHDNPVKAAIAYDKYIFQHGLKRPTNFKLHEIEARAAENG